MLLLLARSNNHTTAVEDAARGAQPGLGSGRIHIYVAAGCLKVCSAAGPGPGHP